MQAELLSHLHLLFGLPGMLPHCLPERPPRFVLGWLAQAYAQRSRLRAPAALVYKRLLSANPPAARYRDHREEHLPHAYLAAVGLAPASYGAAGDSEDEEEQIPPDPSPLALVNGRSILAAWEQAVSLLWAELSHASHHTIT